MGYLPLYMSTVIFLDYNYLGLAVLNRQLAVLSIHLNEKATRPISTNGENIRLSPSAELLEDFSPLATMAAPRCSVGAVALNGKLVVCGGKYFVTLVLHSLVELLLSSDRIASFSSA